MRFSVSAMGIASGLLWGGALLVTGLAHLAQPAYGSLFLDTLASVYPGFHVGRTVGSVLVGAGYGLVDGACAGALLAWLYNVASGRRLASEDREGKL